MSVMIGVLTGKSKVGRTRIDGGFRRESDPVEAIHAGRRKYHAQAIFLRFVLSVVDRG
jgi:hypothetical protein